MRYFPCMKKLHGESHSCIRNAWIHGERRGQCAICGKTWTIWEKKRGRKRSRPDRNLLKKIFVERQRLHQTAGVRLRRISLSGASRRLVRTMEGKEEKAITDGFSAASYILLIDALWHRFGNQSYTLYLRALKRINGHTARFLPPLLLPGKENLKGWQTTINDINPKLKGRIHAVVSDGWRGIERLAKQHHWILQRCHFHLIAQLQVNRGRRKHLPDQSMREEMYQIARKLLITKTKVRWYKEQLALLIQHPDCPKRLKAILRDYLRYLRHFRSYLNHPELNLPTTINAMESMNKQIRQMCRPLRTPVSLLRWATHFLKFNQDIVCNGVQTPQN